MTTHKRFKAFLVTAGLLTAGLFIAREHYQAFATALGGIFSVYATGQSWSDVRQAQAGP